MIERSKSGTRKQRPLTPLADQRKIETARLRLMELYGEQDHYTRRDPMHELISTILSQRTNYANEKLAYETMWSRFGSWKGIRDAPVDELTTAISASNYPEQKAPRIKEVLRRIIAEHGEANIDFLADMPLDEAMKWLLALPGVGLKTATLVLLFYFKKPVLPVDTHVHRVSQRVGMIGAKVTHDKAHAILLDMLPPDPKLLFNFHKHFFWHGQRTCTWFNPVCGQCPLQDICNWYKENKADTSPTEPI
jgi:endonuclease III